MVPGMSCWPVIPMGGIPRLFMAVAQALGSDMGIVMELESIFMLQIPSAEREKKKKDEPESTLLPGKHHDTELFLRSHQIA